MRVFLRCVTAAIAIAVAGCAPSTPLPNLAPPPTNVSAPLNLCAPIDAPPKDLATQPGYVQYAVTVTDGAGNLVRDLKQSDFVAHLGSEPLPIKYFREDKNTPVSIVLVVDDSGSMTAKLVVKDERVLQDVRNDLGEALKNLNKCDELAAIALGGHPSNEADDFRKRGQVRIIQPLTTDHALAVGRITDQVPFGTTALYNGLGEGLQLIESAHYPNRAMIVVTDGLDNTSDEHLNEVLERARKDGVSIYGIGIGLSNARPNPRFVMIGPFVMSTDHAHPDPEDDVVDEKTLKSFSEPSGGKYFVVSELAQDNGRTFVDAVGKVADTLGSGYSIGVIGLTTSASGKQPITIGLANAGSLRVNARKLESTPASSL
jgi:VWFA-related protein